MRVFVVYAHPSEESFTRAARDAFLDGLVDGGYEFELSDLYAMGFRTDMSEAEYAREAYYQLDWPVPKDVMEEQRKIQRCDAIAFIYPVFWTEAPAKLVGWFDRVWTYGFAYGEQRTMKQLDSALALCVTGHTQDKLNELGVLRAMETVMLGDRIFDRAARKRLVALDGMSREVETRKRNWDDHLRTAYLLGRDFETEGRLESGSSS